MNLNSYLFRTALLARGLLAMCVAMAGRSSQGENVVFDNLNVVSTIGSAGDSQDILAQQFFLGDEDTRIFRVEAALRGFGNPTGPITLELWDDDGANTPRERIAHIASIDQQVPFPLQVLTFDTDIRGLTPGNPYYIALSFIDATADFRSDSVAWELVGPDDGTFGAFPALTIGDFVEGNPVPRQWRQVSDDAIGSPFEGQVNYFQMRVEAAPMLLAGDYNADGNVNAPDYVAWRNHLGATAGALPNDVDGGEISSLQYATWKANFGNTAVGANVTAVPEPTSICLAAVCGLILVWKRSQAA